MSKEGSSDGGQEVGGGNKSPGKNENADIFENRGSKKIIRLFTVMAYMFSVSFVAIALSAYYLILWKPPDPRLLRRPIQFLSEPEVQFLLSDRTIVEKESAKKESNSKHSLSGRTGANNLFHNYDHVKTPDEKLNESLILLRNTLIESLENRINDSSSSSSARDSLGENSNFFNYNSFEKGNISSNLRKSREKDARHSSKIMNRIFSNNGTSQTLESPTIPGDEAKRDRFTTVRNYSLYLESVSRDTEFPSDDPTRKTVEDQKQMYKEKNVPSNFKIRMETFDKKKEKDVKTTRYLRDNSFDEGTMMDKRNRDIREHDENLAYNVKPAINLNRVISTDSSNNFEFPNRLQHERSLMKLADFALKFKGNFFMFNFLIFI